MRWPAALALAVATVFDFGPKLEPAKVHHFDPKHPFAHVDEDAKVDESELDTSLLALKQIETTMKNWKAQKDGEYNYTEHKLKAMKEQTQAELKHSREALKTAKEEAEKSQKDMDEYYLKNPDVQRVHYDTSSDDDDAPPSSLLETASDTNANTTKWTPTALMPHIWGSGHETDYLEGSAPPIQAHDVVAEATATEKKVEQDAAKAVQGASPDARVDGSKKTLDLHLDTLLNDVHTVKEKQTKENIRARLEKEFGPDTLGARIIHSYQDAYRPESHATKAEIEEFDRRTPAAAEMTKELAAHHAAFQRASEENAAKFNKVYDKDIAIWQQDVERVDAERMKHSLAVAQHESHPAAAPPEADEWREGGEEARFYSDQERIRALQGESFIQLAEKPAPEKDAGVVESADEIRKDEQEGADEAKKEDGMDQPPKPTKPVGNTAETPDEPNPPTGDILEREAELRKHMARRDLHSIEDRIGHIGEAALPAPHFVAGSLIQKPSADDMMRASIAALGKSLDAAAHPGNGEGTSHSWEILHSGGLGSAEDASPDAPTLADAKHDFAEDAGSLLPKRATFAVDPHAVAPETDVMAPLSSLLQDTEVLERSRDTEAADARIQQSAASMAKSLTSAAAVATASVDARIQEGIQLAAAAEAKVGKAATAAKVTTAAKAKTSAKKTPIDVEGNDSPRVAAAKERIQGDRERISDDEERMKETQKKLLGIHGSSDDDDDDDDDDHEERASAKLERDLQGPNSVLSGYDPAENPNDRPSEYDDPGRWKHVSSTGTWEANQAPEKDDDDDDASSLAEVRSRFSPEEAVEDGADALIKRARDAIADDQEGALRYAPDAIQQAAVEAEVDPDVDSAIAAATPEMAVAPTIDEPSDGSFTPEAGEIPDLLGPVHPLDWADAGMSLLQTGDQSTAYRHHRGRAHSPHLHHDKLHVPSILTEKEPGFNTAKEEKDLDKMRRELTSELDDIHIPVPNARDDEVSFIQDDFPIGHGRPNMFLHHNLKKSKQMRRPSLFSTREKHSKKVHEYAVKQKHHRDQIEKERRELFPINTDRHKHDHGPPADLPHRHMRAQRRAAYDRASLRREHARR